MGARVVGIAPVPSWIADGEGAAASKNAHRSGGQIHLNNAVTICVGHVQLGLGHRDTLCIAEHERQLEGGHHRSGHIDGTNAPDGRVDHVQDTGIASGKRHSTRAIEAELDWHGDRERERERETRDGI